MCSAVVIVLPSGAFITTMPARGRGLDVDIVNAHARSADDSEVWRLVHQLGRNFGRTADDDAIGVRHLSRESFALELGLFDNVNARVGQRFEFVFVNVVGDEYFGHRMR